MCESAARGGGAGSKGRGRRGMAARMDLPKLLLCCLLCYQALGADQTSHLNTACEGDCVIKAERVTPSGRVPLSSGQPLLTAVGCMETIELTWGNHHQLGAPREVKMTAENRSDPIESSSVLDESDEGEKTRICCSEHPLDRQLRLDGVAEERPSLRGSQCADQTNLLQPLNLYTACMKKHKMEKNLTLGTAMVRIQFIVPERADLMVSSTEVYDQMYGSTGFALVAEYISPDGSNQDTIRTTPFIVLLQIQRCSACLKKGEGLNALAKRFGTHWTQIYSANHDIVGTPDLLEESRVVRLGSLYSVRKIDTLMSIALKFGVTVNQLLQWNGFLRTMPDSMPESPNHMSRDLRPDQQVLCVLPKTCFNSFINSSQPVFTQREVSEQGGSHYLPYQVDPPTPPG